MLNAAQYRQEAEELEKTAAAMRRVAELLDTMQLPQAAAPRPYQHYDFPPDATPKQKQAYRLYVSFKRKNQLPVSPYAEWLERYKARKASE